MKFALDIPTAQAFADPHTLVDLAVEAEQAGWEGFFIWDVVFNFETTADPVLDPWVTLAAIAVRTQRMRIGAFLTPLARRRPWNVARQAVTLDHLSRGRLVFGAALGYQALDFTPFGEDYDPRVRAAKLGEALDVLVGLWSGEEFSFQGKHYQIDKVRFLPRPVQPRIPIWLAAGWPRRKPLRRAAQWDGVYLMTVHQETQAMLTPDDVREIRAYVAAHRTRPEPFEIALNVVLPPDPQQAAEKVRPYQAAGATWCVAIPGDASLAAVRALVRSGPPRL